MADMEEQTEKMRTFDMSALTINLPQNRRGLSKCYSGKARSFVCMADVHCLEDLQKQKVHPDVKKRKQQSDRQGLPAPPLHCRRASSTNQFASPIVGL